MYCDCVVTVGIMGSTPHSIVKWCILQRSSPFLFCWIYQSRVDLGHYRFCELRDPRTAPVERCPCQPVLLLPGEYMSLFLNLFVVVEWTDTHIASCGDVQ